MLDALVELVPDGGPALRDALFRLTRTQLAKLMQEIQARGVKLGAAEAAAFGRGNLERVAAVLATHAAQLAGVQRLEDLGSGDALLRVRPPVEAPHLLAQAKSAMLRAVTEVSGAVKTGGMRRDSDPALRYGFKGGLPPGGSSGRSDKVPLGQVLDDERRRQMKQLGLETLVDLVARTGRAESRVVLARASGIPAPALLLVAHRAELLDLPVAPGVAKPMHVKDVVTLARLGIRTVAQLAAIAEVFDARPELVALTYEVVAVMQRRMPATVGAAHITRHELREWPLAARRRQCGITLDQSDDPRVHAAECALSTWLERATLRGEAAWRDLAGRALALAAGGELDREAQKLLAGERVVPIQAAPVEAQPFRGFCLEAPAHTILEALEPWVRPAGEGAFWVGADRIDG